MPTPEPPTEALLSIDPFVVRRRVAWGECDPAGVVYTPRFCDYAVSARDWFLRCGLGVLDRPHPARPGLSFPMRAMSYEFLSFLEPDDAFDMAVRATAATKRTFTLSIAASLAAPQPRAVFSATLTCVAFEQSTRRAVAIPEAMRAALQL